MLSAKTTKVCGHRIIKNEILFLGLILFSNILITGTLYPLVYIFAAILHEFGHLLTIYLLGYSTNDIKFVGFGIRIKNKQAYSYRQEALISLMGPVANGVTVLFAFIGYIFIKSDLINYFIVANLLYAFINLLPFPPLDGYKILLAYLFYKFSFDNANKAVQIISAFAGVVQISLMLILFKYNYLNISLFLIIIILLISAVSELLRK